MKRIIVSAAIFIGAFVISYIGLCYFVPGLRIKLAADAVTYFKESIRHIVFTEKRHIFCYWSMLAGLFFLVAKRKV